MFLIENIVRELEYF